MCGRFTLTEIARIRERFGVVLIGDDDLTPRFNVAPSQGISVVVGWPEGRELLSLEWGFRPAWWTPTAGRPPPINARAETLLERPMFNRAVATHRCIIPADGFYEWRAVPGKRAKQPMYIRLKGGGLYGFAGLYTWRPGSGPDEWLGSCVVITTSPNELLAPIHNRMPVILQPEDEAPWLDTSMDDPAVVLSLLRPYPSERMEAFPVSQLVSSARNDGPALIERVEA